MPTILKYLNSIGNIAIRKICALSIIILINSIFLGSIKAQSIVVNKTYDYSIYFVAHDLLVDQRDSSYYLAGTFGSSATQEYFLMKINELGDTLWLKVSSDSTISGVSGTKLMFNDSGNIILMSRKDGGNNTSILFSEFSTSGNHIFDYSFDLPNLNFYPNSFCFINQKAYVFAFEYDTVFIGGVLISFDSLFSPINITRFSNFGSSSGPKSIYVTSSLSMAVCGDFIDSISNQTQPAVCYVDTMGNISNLRIFPDSGYCYFNSINRTSGNKFCLSEDFHNTISGYKTRFMTLDSSFTILFSNDFNNYTDYSSSIELSDGNDFLAFTYDSSVVIYKEDSINSISSFIDINILLPEIALKGVEKNWNDELIVFGSATDGGVTAHSTFFIVISDSSRFSSSNNEYLKSNKFTIYPNPSIGESFIIRSEFMNRISSIYLLNDLGNEVYKCAIPQHLESEMEINLTFPTLLPSGQYYLLINENQSYIYKLIINR